MELNLILYLAECGSTHKEFVSGIGAVYLQSHKVIILILIKEGSKEENEKDK